MQRLPQVRCCCQGCLLPAQSPHSPLPLPTPTPTRTPTCTAARRKRSCIATRSSRIIRFSESCWSAVRTASSTVWRSQAARSRSSAVLPDTEPAPCRSSSSLISPNA
jgi:hypothetical protein